MENLSKQIFQVTDNFLTTIQQLTAQHTAQVLQETFSSLDKTNHATSTATRSRGAKRGTDELDQLSKRFAQFVHDNPGLRIEQINKQLGTTTAELALPIRKLIASGDVTTKGKKRSTAYFAGKRSTASAPTSTGEDKVEAPAGKSNKKRSRSKKNRAAARSKGKSKK
jgi:hypothetical protein